jgi:hypothetical protein
MQRLASIFLEERRRWANSKPDGPAPTIATLNGVLVEDVAVSTSLDDDADCKGDN